jgi:group I intron endonuclease
MTSKFHYTYWLEDEVGKSYIGSRTSIVYPSEDNYWGSSLLVNEAIASGVKFNKKILAIWEDRESAISHEVLLHEIFDVAKNDLFYNRARQTSTKFIRDVSGWNHSDKTKQILSKQKSGSGNPNFGKSGPGTTAYGHRHTSEQKAKMALQGSKNGMFNKKHTPESIEKMKANIGDRFGENNPFFGKKHSEQSKKFGPSNHMFGVIREKHPNAKKVHTPFGTFNCVLDAAEALKVSSQTIRNRVKSKQEQFAQYYFEGKTNDNTTV